MSLETKCSKLRFIAQEMDVAHALASHAPTPFIARILARHVLSRAQDFSAIARDVPSLVRSRGRDVTDFKIRTKAYAESFEEYYETTRTKIVAHVQDLEWIERLELWTDMEVVNVAYFAEGARELYEALGLIGLPGYQPYLAEPELSVPAFRAALTAIAASRPRRTESSA